MPEAKIVVEQLYKVFGPRPHEALARVKAGASKQSLLTDSGHVLGLSDINLAIAEQEIFVIMGLSGSGKSTLIRHFNRLIEPTEGTISIDGQDVLKLARRDLEAFRRRKMSMVFQRFGLLPHRTVLQNVGYGLAVQNFDRVSMVFQRLFGLLPNRTVLQNVEYGLTMQNLDKAEVNKRAMQWIEQVGLEGFEEHYPGQLSGGMQQRVGLARALATDAEILLMDEAFSALDPLIRTSMQDLLLDLQTKLNKTIVFITHDLDEALKLGDTIAILNDGMVVQAGDPQDIIMHPANEYIENFVQDINRARVIRARSIMEPVASANGADLQGEVAANDNLEVVLAAMQGNPDGCVGVTQDGQTVGAITARRMLEVLPPQR